MEECNLFLVPALFYFPSGCTCVVIAVSLSFESLLGVDVCAVLEQLTASSQLTLNQPSVQV